MGANLNDLKKIKSMFMWKFVHIELVFSEFLILILWMKTLINCVTIQTAFDLVQVKQKQVIIV